MKSPMLIGIAGGTGSGKSTFAERLLALFPNEILSFNVLDALASKLKTLESSPMSLHFGFFVSLFIKFPPNTFMPLL